MRQVIRQVFRKHLLQFVIEEVALRDGKNPLLVEHLGIEVAQFAKQHLIFMTDVVRIARYHEKQEGVTLDMTQESKSQATAFGSAFDDARNVGHYKGLSVSVRHNAERRFHCCERIACNLWASTRQGTEQRTLSCIRKAYESNVCQQLQLKDDSTFNHRFARLSIARSLISRGREMLVTHAASTAFEEHHNLSIVGYIAYVFTSFSIINDSATRNIDVTVLAICSCASAGTSIASVSCKDMTLEAKMQQRPVVVIASQIDMTASPTIATIWSAHGDILGTMHVH